MPAGCTERENLRASKDGADLRMQELSTVATYQVGSADGVRNDEVAVGRIRRNFVIIFRSRCQDAGNRRSHSDAEIRPIVLSEGSYDSGEKYDDNEIIPVSHF